MLAADPDAKVVGLSGDYDFQFLIEELAVGAQFNLPYRARRGEQLLSRIDPPGATRLRHGLLRVSWPSTTSTPRSPTATCRRATASITSRVVEGLGCKAIQVVEPQDIGPALERARQLAREHKVPVMVEVFLERVTNIAMGTEIDNVVEFNDLAETLEDAPTAAALLLLD